MNTLIHQRCFNHKDREAVARCPECGRYFCRECITEHEDRVLCASCLAKTTQKSSHGLSRLSRFFRTIQVIIGVILLWIFFYYMGQILLSIPTSFHEGTIWSGKWWE
jgi:hypothetical protein